MGPDILHPCLRPTATGGAAVLKFLIDKSADINHVAAETGTPLHCAAFLGKENEVRTLLHAGADPSVVIIGETPTSIAKTNGRMHIY
jgi:ankyrin repeat protein